MFIALAVGLYTDDRGGPTSSSAGSLVAAVTGTTDQLSGADIAGAPTISPTPGRLEPSRQQWADLLPKLKAVAQQNPDDVGAQRKLALAYYNLGKFPEALNIYRYLLARGEDAVLRNRLGNTLRDMGDPAGAEAAYRKAIGGDPTLAPPYLNLAELLWRQGLNDKALAVLADGLAAVPEDARSALEKARQLLAGQEGGPTT